MSLLVLNKWIVSKSYIDFKSCSFQSYIHIQNVIINIDSVNKYIFTTNKITSEKKQIWENTSLLIFSSSKLFNSRFFSLSFSDIHTHWVSLKVHYYLTILQWASCGFVRLKVHLKQYNGYEILSKGGNTAIVSGILHTAL